MQNAETYTLFAVCVLNFPILYIYKIVEIEIFKQYHFKFITKDADGSDDWLVMVVSWLINVNISFKFQPQMCTETTIRKTRHLKYTP